MLFSGYLSKHLYGRIVSSQSESIKTPLDDEELKALKKFKVSYKIVFNNDLVIGIILSIIAFILTNNQLKKQN
mgnify:FL=1